VGFVEISAHQITMTQQITPPTSRFTHYALRFTHFPSLLPLIAILLLATFLRFYRLAHQSLWADEGNSLALAQRGFMEIAQRTAFDIHPPAYYWLLKIWTALFGYSEVGLRSLSAALGVGVVYLVWLLGRQLFSPKIGLLAALIAALSPLQVYYSQEARMYMLLTLLGSATVLAAVEILIGYTLVETCGAYCVMRNPFLSVVYIFTVTAGLYTHYAYPVILLVVNLTAVIYFIQNSQYPKGTLFVIRNSEFPGLLKAGKTPNSKPLHWLALQLIPLLLYLPWLPIAWRQITTWPSERPAGALSDTLGTVSNTLLFGLSWPYNLEWLAAITLGFSLAASLWLGGKRKVASSKWQETRTTHHALRATPPRSSLLTLLLWLLLPIILTIAIFSPAFLKFLLVAAPALALLLAIAIATVATNFARRWIDNLVGAILLAALTITSLLSLYHYYTNPAFARDNYRGIAQFIKAIGNANDAIILNAEGQQDVFNYYYEAGVDIRAPVYPLPQRRPLNEAEILAELQRIAAESRKIYAVYWATHQADPNGLIEGWLDTHLFKATDQWYGNVRLVSYAGLREHNIELTPVDHQLGEHIQLTGYGLSSSQVAPGDILQTTFRWQTNEALSEDYTIFLQILDSNNHLVGQRDAKPQTPSLQWPVGETISDAHGIFIEPGTPPGQHRLIAGLYNSQSGRRLPVISASGQPREFVELGEIEIVRPAAPLPVEAFNIQTPLRVALPGMTFLGYDLHKLGHRSTPDTPLHPGDPVQLVAYWRLEDSTQQLPDEITIRVAKSYDEETSISVIKPLAGVDYPIKQWQAGEIVRAQYSFFLTDLEPGSYRAVLSLSGPTPAGEDTVFTQPFQVEE
jgi:4-amino-4-deoxy-L-arabinose transferase-like glycosyltransferase